MKRGKCFLLVCVLLMLCTVIGAASFTVNEIRSVQSMQGAEISLDLGPLSVTGGVDALYVHAMLIDTTKMNVDQNLIIKADGALLMPSVGARILLGRKPVRLLVKGSVYQMIPMFDLSVRVDNQEVVTEDIIADVKNTFNAISFYGGKVGIGADYRINDHISLIGETGLRFYFAEVDVLDLLGIGYTSHILNIEALFGTTYTSLGLSFHF